ncbi:MAG: fused response regulator/phosphatase [Micromonosporaceae bacterium]|nr:fused response regulator/phosphatase [Micromonosporaceae bacterium]
MAAQVDPGAVLVVVQDERRCSVLAGWLRGAGHRVWTADTGDRAVKLAVGTRLDAIVLDAQLLNRDRDFCAELKALPAQRSTPLLHVAPAGASDVPLSEQCDAYLVEPVTRGTLLAAVQASIRGARVRRGSERLAARLAELAQAVSDLSRATTVPELLSVAATSAARIFECQVVVSAVDLEGVRLAAACPGLDLPATVQAWTGPAEPLAIGTRLVDDPPHRWPMLHWPDGDTVRVIIARPRRERRAVYIAVPTGTADVGSPVTTQLAHAVASSIEVLRGYADQRDLSLTLQRSLLPRRLPSIDGVDIAVRYEPASAHAEIGGDFYELSYVDNRLAVAVGDVAGHSLHAATVMAELRHALRAYLADGYPPQGVIQRLNQLMLTLIPDEAATVCLVSLDPATGEFVLANAGHPAPLVCHQGRVEPLDERGPLLGIRAAHDSGLVGSLPVGGTLVLYTDGLIERRGADLQEGLDRLAAAAATVEEDLDGFCDRLLTEVNPAIDDDIALLALRRQAPES